MASITSVMKKVKVVDELSGAVAITCIYPGDLIWDVIWGIPDPVLVLAVGKEHKGIKAGESGLWLTCLTKLGIRTVLCDKKEKFKVLQTSECTT